MASTREIVKGIQSVLLKGALLVSVAVVVHAIEPEVPSPGQDALQAKSAVCQEGEGCEGKQRMCEKKMKERHDQVASELKLDEKQRQLFDEATGKMHSGMRDGMSLHQQLKALVHSSDYSEQKARELVRKYHAEQEEQLVASANAMHAFHTSLSAEQQQKFKALKDEMRNKMKRHGEEGREAHEGHEGHDEQRKEHGDPAGAH